MQTTQFFQFLNWRQYVMTKHCVSLHHALELARHAEKLGYERLWLAEHHNMEGIASSATPAVLLGYLLANTTSIKSGFWWHYVAQPCAIGRCEQFGTLATLYQNRVE